MRRLAFLACALALAASLACARGQDPPAAHTAPELWLWCSVNLADDSSLARMDAVWRRAAASGYRHVMLSDPKFSRLDQMDDRYFENVRRVKSLASNLGLEIVPALFTVGRANGELTHDPNLVEGLRVQDARFEVRAGIARPLTEPAVTIPRDPAFSDREVRIANGVATVRDNAAHARFRFALKVAPHRCYHVSVMIRTQDFTGQPMIQVLSDGRAIHFPRSLGVPPTEDWTRHDLVFNSLDHDQIDLWFGAWKPAHGTLEWKDWKIEEPGPFNLVRRDSEPFVVTSDVSAGATRYVEGRDFERIADPALGRSPSPGEYRGWHDPPALHTRLRDGTRLRVSWTQAAVVYDRQVACCLSDTGTASLLADQARRVRAAWNARGYLMMHDEIRALGSDEACASRHLTPGQILAANARDCSRLLEGSTVYVWNDMFDPLQNAVKDYHLIPGDLHGSWEGLDPSVVIVNWNGDHKNESLKFFAARGHRQIIAGYYDGRVEDIGDWLRSAAEVPSVTGVMFTTWQDRYDDLEAFARAVREFR
ncbi:MAG TPA: hypothetical protein VL123_07750 [Candidatus Udaeobacter sp.]|jgi:hypothetical protein|nr:hypothetical protein [Candidatus Udaeobacter sp.]